MPVQLNEVVPWGRSFDEYAAMFALDEHDLAGTILDVAGGPSSFNAEMTARGRCVVSIDAIYRFSADEIRSRVQAVRGPMMEQVRNDPGHFVWEFIQSPDMLEQMRLGAMERFLADYPAGVAEGRYLARECPRLQLDARFDLALSSHFLLLYSDQLDLEFHLATIREMTRVATQVRIFPILDLQGRISMHLPAVQREFGGELVRVKHEFLRGANQMLVIG